MERERERDRGRERERERERKRERESEREKEKKQNPLSAFPCMRNLKCALVSTDCLLLFLG